MDHFAKPRPQLPGTTPILLSSTKKSAYASTSFDEIRLQRPTTSPDVFNDRNEKQNPQARLLSKLISRLPFEMRESIGSAFDMIIQAAELAKRECNSHKLEVLSLQDDVARKKSEIMTLFKSADVYQQKIHDLEVQLDEMKDNMDSRQKFLVRNRRSVDRMASTNRMFVNYSFFSFIWLLLEFQFVLLSRLIGSLDSLQQTSGAADTENNTRDKRSSSPVQATTTGMSDKLRESLLRVSREHYASIKKVNVSRSPISQVLLPLCLFPLG